MDRGVWIVCGSGALIHTLYFDSYPYDSLCLLKCPKDGYVTAKDPYRDQLKTCFVRTSENIVVRAVLQDVLHVLNMRPATGLAVDHSWDGKLLQRCSLVQNLTCVV